MPELGGPLADGRAFAEWLARRRELPEAGRAEVLMVDSRYVQTARGLVPRRWPALKLAWLPDSRRLGVALWAPWIGGWAWWAPR